MSNSTIPEGYSTVTSYLVVNPAHEAIAFYKQAFGAVEVMRLTAPDQRIGHAELNIGDTRIMLADEFPEMGCKCPHSYGGTPVSFMIYVEDVDQQFKQAVDAGAKVIREVEDQFYGDRTGMVEDPFGHLWNLATHKEDVPFEEANRRFQEMMSQNEGS